MDYRRGVVSGDYPGLQILIQNYTLLYIVLESGLQRTTKRSRLRTSESNTELYRNIHYYI